MNDNGYVNSDAEIRIIEKDLIVIDKEFERREIEKAVICLKKWESCRNAWASI